MIDRYDVVAVVGMILVVLALILAGFWLPLTLAMIGTDMVFVSMILAGRRGR